MSEPTGLSGCALGAATVELAVARERVDAAVLVHVAAVLRSECWKVDGVLSPVAWLVGRCGLSEVEARATVRAARLLLSCEGLAERFVAGQVMAGHVRVLARVVIGARRELFERDRDLLCELAAGLGVDDFAAVAARWGSCADDQLGRGEPRKIHEQRGVSVSYHGGRGERYARGVAADIAQLVHRLDQHAPPDPAEMPCRRSRSQRRLDALCELVDRGAGAARAGRRPRPDRAFTVLIDAETFRGGFNPPRSLRDQLGGARLESDRRALRVRQPLAGPGVQPPR